MQSEVLRKRLAQRREYNIQKREQKRKKIQRENGKRAALRTPFSPPQKRRPALGFASVYKVAEGVKVGAIHRDPYLAAEAEKGNSKKCIGRVRIDWHPSRPFQW